MNYHNDKLTVGSLFAGIGGFDLAFHRCGIRTVWAAEKDKKCNSVRRRHFPDEETVTDVADVSGTRFRADILVGGFPCQDISVAGKRAGLAGKRSGLWWEFARIIEEQTPRWVLIENVGGLLSSNGGGDLGAILGTLGQLGYGFAYRVLDAQWWGVPQRRRRIFIVGCLGDWRRAAEVLFEPESLPWDSPPSRETGTGVAALTANGVGTCGADDNQGQAGHLIARTLNAHGGSGRMDVSTETLVSVAFDCKKSGEGGEVFPPLRAMGGNQGRPAGNGHAAVAYRTSGNCGVTEQGDKTAALNTATDPTQTIIGFNSDQSEKTRSMGEHAEQSPTLRAGGEVSVAFAQSTRDEVRETGGNIVGALASQPGMKQQTYLRQGMAVRRLMPIECERLQGFPDDFTKYGEHGEEIADGPRYRMLGNAVAVPVVEWIARRIMETKDAKLPQG